MIGFDDLVLWYCVGMCNCDVGIIGCYDMIVVIVFYDGVGDNGVMFLDWWFVF